MARKYMNARYVSSAHAFYKFLLLQMGKVGKPFNGFWKYLNLKINILVQKYEKMLIRNEWLIKCLQKIAVFQLKTLLFIY